MRLSRCEIEKNKNVPKHCQVSRVKTVYHVLLRPHFYFTSIGFGLELSFQTESLHQNKDWTTILYFFANHLEQPRTSEAFWASADLCSTLAPERCQDTRHKSEHQCSQFSSQQQTEQRPNRRRAVNLNLTSKPHFLRVPGTFQNFSLESSTFQHHPYRGE